MGDDFWCTRAEARLTATVVVPTPPLLPITLKMRPFFFSGMTSRFSIPALKLSRAATISPTIEGLREKLRQSHLDDSHQDIGVFIRRVDKDVF